MINIGDTEITKVYYTDNSGVAKEITNIYQGETLVYTNSASS